jgi:NAD+ diphosphatase
VSPGRSAGPGASQADTQAGAQAEDQPQAGAQTKDQPQAESETQEQAGNREPAEQTAAEARPEAQIQEQAEALEPPEDPAQAQAQARAQAQAQDFAELGGLMLARSTVDRVSVRRGDPEWVAAAWADPRTRVLVLDTSGQALVRFGDKAAELVLVPPSEAPDGLSFLLGVDDDGVTYFGLLERPVESPEPAGTEAEPARPEQQTTQQQAAWLAKAGPGERRAGLREAAALLGDRDAGLFTHAVALANWHVSHTHCPRCGALTETFAAGHAQRCPVDGSEHFPRIDPAVIMLVTDQDDRCLLARNRRWPPRRVSILAGFVEPGESAEQAVAREVGEETGIAVSRVRYVGSQPWPMPQSLMLGFRAVASGDLSLRVDDEEIAEAQWYSRDELRAALAAGDILLPPPVSIAHRLIESWYGGELPGVW